MRLVGYEVLKRHFNKPGLLPSHDIEYGQGLHRTLVYPASRQVSWSGDANLDAGRVGEINNMRLHTEAGGKIIVSAGALVKMAALRAYHAQVTLGQLFEAGVAVALAEAFFAGAATLNALDLAQERERDLAANMLVQGNGLFIQTQEILDRGRRGATAFGYLAGHLSKKTAHGVSLEHTHAEGEAAYPVSTG